MHNDLSEYNKLEVSDDKYISKMYIIYSISQIPEIWINIPLLFFYIIQKYMGVI